MIVRSRWSAALLAGSLACSSGGGAKSPEAAPVPAPPPADLPPVLVLEGPAPSFEGIATGNGWVDGSASAEAGARYFREVSGTRGQQFELRNDATGDEKDKACGKDWRASSARSVVVVTPDAGRGTVGFALSATASARRGYWRTKATLSCTTLNHTDAQAASMARGQAWVTLAGGPADRDQLVVETTGFDAGEWALSVTDTAGQKFTPAQVGTAQVAAIPGGGRYSVAASVTARVSTAGAKDSVEQRLRATVRVSSLRNALAAATGRVPLPELDLPVPITIPAAELAERMQAQLQGYKPCGAPGGCGGKVSDLSTTTVNVRPAGGGAVVELALVATKKNPLTVRLVGNTRVHADSLSLVNLRLAPGQADLAKKRDLSVALARLAERAAGAAVDLAPRTRAADAQLRTRFPVRVGELCSGVMPGSAAFLGTRPAADTTAFLAVFGVTPGLVQPCPKGR